MSSPPPRTPRRRAAVTESLTLLGIAPLVAGVLLVPPWYAERRLAATLVGALVLIAALITTYVSRSRAGLRGRDSALTGWPRAAVASGVLLGGIGAGLVGPSVVAAQSMPSRPLVVPAMGTHTDCARLCPPEVTFRIEGLEVTAAYPPGLTSAPGPGTLFAVDPAEPRQVMPLAALEFARGPGRWWLGLAVMAFVGGPVSGALGSVRAFRHAGH